ncbi:hypothetical protein T484DRAFT_1932225 [Baffinella frigidus]|nr:hypothetical protein T484DRAFT_1932225 [Cryptophyta sp. CCMP2293]
MEAHARTCMEARARTCMLNPHPYPPKHVACLHANPDPSRQANPSTKSPVYDEPATNRYNATS